MSLWDLKNASLCTAQNWFFILWNLGTRHLFSYLWCSVLQVWTNTQVREDNWRSLYTEPADWWRQVRVRIFLFLTDCAIRPVLQISDVCSSFFIFSCQCLWYEGCITLARDRNRHRLWWLDKFLDKLYVLNYFWPKSSD